LQVSGITDVKQQLRSNHWQS